MQKQTLAPATEPLRFDRAEYESAAAASPTCSRCQQVPAVQYYSSGGSTYCGRCVELVRNSSSAPGGFARAIGLGLLAALGGSAAWYGILAATGYEFSLLGIVIGFAVGAAVRHGSGGRGGWKYQTLAMLLIYLSIVSSYVPMLLEGLVESNGPAQNGIEQAFRIAFSFVLAPIVPFLAGIENLLGLFIIGVGVFEGWKLNKRSTTTFEGPFPVPATDPAQAA